MNYHILFIEPYVHTDTKPQTIADFVKTLVRQVDTAGGKIYVSHDVVMMGVYDATIIVVVNYSGCLLPGSTADIKAITVSFPDETALLNHSLIKNISGLKRAYRKSKSLFGIGCT